MAQILADHREGKGANPFLEAFVEENNKKYAKYNSKSGGGMIDMQIRQLTVGDYAIMLNQEGTYKLVMIIERKTWVDLAGSIKGGRIEKQEQNMKEMKDQGCLCYFIMEGAIKKSDKSEVGGIAFSSLTAKARHLALRGFPYFQTLDSAETAKLIVNLARDCIKLYQRKELFVSEVRDIEGGKEDIEEPFTEFTESDIPRALLERKVKSNQDIIKEMWLSLPGVSTKSAEVLMPLFTIRELLTSRGEGYSITLEKIAETKYATGRKLGKDFANKIMVIAYTGENNPARLEKARDAWVKLLACIPQVSSRCARYIVTNIMLPDLCEGKITTEELAMISRTERTRIGEALAGKICSIMSEV